MMASSDLATEVLIQIRDELKHTREALSSRLDATNSRLDTTNSRLDETNSRLDRVERRQSETETRLATELIGVANAVNQLKDMLMADRVLRQRVDEHDRRIALLEQHAH